MWKYQSALLISALCVRLLICSIIPLSIVGQHRFYDTLTNFLSLIGYWATAWITILLTEHFVFRKGDFSSYDLRAWNRPSLLPTGIAAVSAGVLSFGLVIPAMDQVWFTGPIAKKTGDLGFELAFFTSAVLYLPLRWVEKRWRGI